MYLQQGGLGHAGLFSWRAVGLSGLAMLVRMVRMVLWLGCAACLPALAQTGGAGAAPAAVSAPPAASSHILLLYSYGHGSQGIRVFDRGLMDTLRARGISASQLSFEYLDLERNQGDPQYRPRLRTLLERKYRGRHIDLVVAVQQPALGFVLNEGRELGVGAPVVSVQAPVPSEAEAGTRRVVSVLSDFDIRGTLERALELFPATRRVVVVSGSSDADRKLARRVLELARDWAGKLEFEFTTDMALDDILRRAAALPPGSVVIFTQFNRDARGLVTVAYEVEHKLVQVANAPVFGLYDYNLTNGGIGGSVIPVEGLGANTARLALDLLTGRQTLTQQRTQVDLQPVSMVSWPALERWGGQAQRLAPQTVFVGRVPTLWQQYWPYAIGVVLFILLQSWLLAALWLHRARARRAAAALAAERDTAQRYLDIADVMLMALDRQGRILMINRKGAQILGAAEGGLIGRDWFDSFIPAAQRGLMRDVFARILTGREAILAHHENAIVNTRGEEVVLAWNNVLLRDETGAATGTLSSAEDITARRQAAARIEELAFYDQLTGLPNLALLQERLGLRLAESARQFSHGALLLIDLDHFKHLNDTLGRASGDALLQRVAQRLLDTAGGQALVARMSGAAFAVVFSGLGPDRDTARDAALQAGKRLQVALNQDHPMAAAPLHSTASVGICLFLGAGVEAPQLMRQAELAMHEAKSAGRDTVRLFDPELATPDNGR